MTIRNATWSRYGNRRPRASTPNQYGLRSTTTFWSATNSASRHAPLVTSFAGGVSVPYDDVKWPARQAGSSTCFGITRTELTEDSIMALARGAVMRNVSESGAS